jgi:DMSO/TMAO reductase YedYZ molybdopterin-dependent catalytic subunit
VDKPVSRPSWPTALLIALTATAVALRLQSLLRDVWQIRTLPERVMEWLLLFVPLDVFERGVQQFGANAKDIALVGTFAGMALLLLAIGVAAARRGWPAWRLLILGLVLWLLTMALVMPLTGAGFFATGLLLSAQLVNAGYLAVFLGYSSVLILGRLFVARGPTERAQVSGERRALLEGVGGTLVALGVTRAVGRDGGGVVSTLPLALPPTPRPPSPTPAATLPQGSLVITNGRPTAAPALPPTPAATPAPTGIVEVTPTAAPIPVPAPSRELVRGKDGVLTAAGRVPGTLAPTITSNADFYVVTKNPVADPVVDPINWRLIVDGEVNRPYQIDYRTLRALPTVEVTKTLECISNFTARCDLASFGCDLISTATWKGVRLNDLLDLAEGLTPDVVALAFMSVDEFSAGLPPEVADDPETVVVYEMNGETLPREHGYPARLLVPGRYGMKSPKWLAGIRALNTDYLGWYEQRNWNKAGIVKTMARIDVPATGARLDPGPQRVAGIAYAGSRGIRQVEISADSGRSWQPTSLLEQPAGGDAMVRWEGSFELAAGERATLVVRATDGQDEVQTAEFVLPQPDGASGRHSVEVQASG